MIGCRGSVPLSVIGVLLVMIAALWSSAFSSQQHYRALVDASFRALLDQEWLAQNFKARVRSLLRLAVENALVRCDEGGFFSEHSVELLSSARFWSGVREWARKGFHSEFLEISIPSRYPLMDIRPLPDGRVLAVLPATENFYVTLRSPDSSVRLSVPLGGLSVLVAPRPFLLDNLMKQFMDELSNGLDEWWKLEYVRMWAEAWTLGRVTLDRRIDQLLFEIAWALEEQRIFGTFDPYIGGSGGFGTGTFQLAGSGEWLPDFGPIRRLREALADIDAVLSEAESELRESLSLLRSANVARSRQHISNAAALVREAGDELQNALGFERTTALAEAVVFSLRSLPVENALDRLSTLLASARATLERTLENENVSDVIDFVLENIEQALGIGDGHPDGFETLPGLRSLVLGIIKDLEKILEFEPAPEIFPKLDEIFGITAPVLPANRELAYRLTPPVVSGDGVAVYRELKVGGIEYSRGDPAGWLGSSSATWIYLPYLNLSLWYADVTVSVEVAGGREELIDVQNPCLLRPTELGWLYLPYAHRESIPTRKFEANVKILSLRPFSFAER
jgi:hypothetical protein